MQDGSFAQIFKRLKSIIARSHDNDLKAPPRDQAETAAMAATTLPTSCAITHRIPSNPMSS